MHRRRQEGERGQRNSWRVSSGRRKRSREGYSLWNRHSHHLSSELPSTYVMPSPVDLPSLPSSFLLSLCRFHFLGGRSQLLSSLLISLPFCPPPAAMVHTACVCVCARARATTRGNERERKTEKGGGSRKAVKRAE